MIKVTRAPSHPGELLKDELEDLGITVTKAATDLQISRNLLHGILAGRKPIRPDTAVKIGKYLGNGGGLWLRMQAAYDLYHTEKASASIVRHIPEAARIESR
jgi:addiction module HigA family antidote